MTFNVLLFVAIALLVVRWYLRLKDELKPGLGVSRAIGNIVLFTLEIPLLLLNISLSIVVFDALSGALFENPGTGLGAVMFASIFAIVVGSFLGVVCLLILSMLNSEKEWKLYDKLYALLYVWPIVSFFLMFI